MSAVTNARERIRAGWRILQTQWRATCELWNDPVRRRFERDFWQEWEQVVPSTMDAMQYLAEVISAARRAVR